VLDDFAVTGEHGRESAQQPTREVPRVGHPVRC
jgi:hypothetical protein